MVIRLKRIISLLTIAVILFSVAIVPNPVFAQSSEGVKEEYINEDKWLTLSKNKTGARYFVDVNGNPVNLFGMARCQSHAHEEDVLYSPSKERDVDSLIKHYADYGCNFIRLAINISPLCGGAKKTPQEINEFISRNIDPDVQAIIRNGMYVMLDIHMYPNPEGKRTARTLVQFARDYYLPVLKELAKKYKDEPMVAVYELWNEPYPADIEAPPPEDTEGDWANQLRSYFIDAVNEMRKIDTRHVIMVSDHNAGWGCALTELWDGYYKKLDPVYQNTCFSVHVSHSQLDGSYKFYSDWWKSVARGNNICLLFGEIETEPGISTTQGIKNLVQFLSETEKDYHFSGVLWRPHGEAAEYSDIWAKSGWADKYCNVGPFPSERYVVETENLIGLELNNAEKIVDPAFFGTKKLGTAISLKAGLSNKVFHESTTEIDKKIVYNKGKYKLIVRAAGKKNYEGDFIIGYKDVSGVVHQIARFSGKNTNMEPYYQTVEFTADKQIASFVFFGCEKNEKSAIIDRLYIIGKSANGVISGRSKLKIPNTKKIVYLNGSSANVNIKEPQVDNSFDYSDDYNSYIDGLDNFVVNTNPNVNIYRDDILEDNADKNKVPSSDKDNADKGNQDVNNNTDKENSSNNENNSGNKENSDENHSVNSNIETNKTDVSKTNAENNKGEDSFTKIVIIIIIGAALLWLILLFGVIILKRRKKVK